MSPELRAEIQAKIAELEPKERELWKYYSGLGDALVAMAKPANEARAAWSDVCIQLANLKRMLPPEVQAETPKDKVPF